MSPAAAFCSCGVRATCSGARLKIFPPSVKSRRMIKAILCALLLVATQMAQAQGTTQAMLGFQGTTPAGGNPESSSIYSSISGPIGWTFQATTAINVTALGAFNYLMPGQGSLRVGMWN